MIHIVRTQNYLRSIFKPMYKYSASAADTMVLRMILQTTSIVRLTVGTQSSGFFGLGGTFTKKMDTIGPASTLRY